MKYYTGPTVWSVAMNALLRERHYVGRHRDWNHTCMFICVTPVFPVSFFYSDILPFAHQSFFFFFQDDSLWLLLLKHVISEYFALFFV